MSEHAWHSYSATELAKKIQQGKLSSRELLESYIQRYQDKNRPLNAIVATDFTAARERADLADKATKQGESWGPLHGIPMTVKDTYEMPGMPCSAGAKEYRKHFPKQPASAVSKLLNAGAIIYGKTNVPEYASDIQSYNPVYGTTNNPWDTQRTPGGSSGGAAAALAAGMTPLELGSDLAGSIRIPAHYCGVYGHKATHGLISLEGHVPGPPGTVGEPDLTVAGPMARSAKDLNLLLDIVGGKIPSMDSAWDLNLPEKSNRALSDYKVLMWTEDPSCTIDTRMAAKYQELKQQLEAQGAKVTQASPLDTYIDEVYPVYMRLLGSLVGAAQPKPQRLVMGAIGSVLPKLNGIIDSPSHFDKFLKGINMDYAEYLVYSQKSQQMRIAFVKVFEEYDLILMPPTATVAINHIQVPDLPRRRIPINGEKRAYTDLFMWISVATLFGLPATSAPIGTTDCGLPINIQIMGAPYKDRETIHFAELLEDNIASFQAPPAYI
ncbi:MAG: amidase [Pseudomonadales bacterium]|nr:amidase [Pseudomonadales bacterium]